MPALAMALHEEKPPPPLPPSELLPAASAPAKNTRSATGKQPAKKAPSAQAATAAAAEDPPKEKPRRGRRRLLQDEEQRKARRKVQCKLNQRRYRARQRGLISTLSLETEGLGDHLQGLRDYRDFLRDYYVPARSLSAWDDPRPVLVASHFLRAFRAGFALHSTESSALQESFVRLVCAPDVIAQGAASDGVDALLLQLQRYTSYHGTFELRPASVKLVHAPTQAMDAQAAEHKLSWVVEARGSVSLRISRDTLMLVYPHVLRHHDDLAQRVVGQTIEPEFTAVFHFDPHAKVTKLDQHVDFAGAFLRLLGSVQDVATLLGRALISPLSELGLDPQGTTTESALTRGGSKQLSLKFILL
ncbi:bZIP transcription factor 1 [Phytophthora cinnamomi]|uniref:bZIP transcription factor 1 n=1 Tax=Phytophthora cinnamomi TaxID=4785 RepID=UPI003559E914|nr:bZIP transcription factor 1 [Phytophthora cinnamomi]